MQKAVAPFQGGGSSEHDGASVKIPTAEEPGPRGGRG